MCKFFYNKRHNLTTLVISLMLLIVISVAMGISYIYHINHIIKVGYLVDRKPWSYKDSDNKVLGSDIEIFTNIYKQFFTKYKIKYVPILYKNIDEIVKDKKVDIILGGITNSDINIKSKYNIMYYHYYPNVLFASLKNYLKSNITDNSISIITIDSLRNYKVGCASTALCKVLEEFIYKPSNIFAYSDIKSLMTGLRNHEVDAMLVERELYNNLKNPDIVSISSDIKGKSLYALSSGYGIIFLNPKLYYIIQSDKNKNNK